MSSFKVKTHCKKVANNIQNKICDVCGKEFTPNRSYQKRCSKECASEQVKKNYCINREKMKAYSKERYAKFYKPKRYDKECINCGNNFVAKKNDAMFCSGECSKKVRFQDPETVKKYKELSKKWELKYKPERALKKKIWRLKKEGRLAEAEKLQKKLDKLKLKRRSPSLSTRQKQQV